MWNCGSLKLKTFLLLRILEDPCPPSLRIIFLGVQHFVPVLIVKFLFLLDLGPDKCTEPSEEACYD